MKRRGPRAIERRPPRHRRGGEGDEWGDLGGPGKMRRGVGRWSRPSTHLHDLIAGSVGPVALGEWAGQKGVDGRGSPSSHASGRRPGRHSDGGGHLLGVRRAEGERFRPPPLQPLLLSKREAPGQRRISESRFRWRQSFCVPRGTRGRVRLGCPFHVERGRSLRSPAPFHVERSDAEARNARRQARQPAALRPYRSSSRLDFRVAVPRGTPTDRPAHASLDG